MFRLHSWAIGRANGERIRPEIPNRGNMMVFLAVTVVRAVLVALWEAVTTVFQSSFFGEVFYSMCPLRYSALYLRMHWGRA